MLWDSFASSEPGSLHRIEGTMGKEDYKEKHQNYLKKDARNLGIGRRWWFQHNFKFMQDDHITWTTWKKLQRRMAKHTFKYFF